jgi:hypothetical protein
LTCPAEKEKQSCRANDRSYHRRNPL